ncbi:MAG TPA: hypothetical protein VK669_09775 [Candidatus Limnocylindrales bacterium]|nr:hypothetical protein [Candidatus Limnocylindrales bacterium]
MVRRAPAFAFAALLGTAPLLASAAEGPRPIRSLTYAVDLHIIESLDTPGSGIAPQRVTVPVKGRSNSSPPRPQIGSAEGHTSGGMSAQGSITIDVLEATDDAGLVVEIAEDAPKRERPKVKVGIAADGTLFYDAANYDNLTEEELAVVRWLGRSFYGDHPKEVGTAWTVDQSTNGHTDIERYRVLARDDARVTLDYALEERTSSVGGFAGTRAGSIVYDTVMILPVKVSFESVARRQLGQSYNTLRTSIRLTLTADSFAKR